MPNERKRPLKVGLFLPPFEAVPAGVIPRWSELKAVAQRADELGYDSLWIPDHLIFRLPDLPEHGAWDAWSVLAALAAVTNRVELGHLVLCTPFRNPALLAKMADTVDEISGGRLILALGAGWHKPEFDAFGFPFDHLASRFEEAIQIIHGLLRDGHVDFEGAFYSARDCELRPRGPRPNGPPILIGAYKPRMLRLTARYADLWNVDWRNQAAKFAGWTPRVDAACAEVGRDPATLGRTAAIMVDLSGSAGRLAKFEESLPLRGTPEELAEELRAFALAGASHVQVWLDPNTVAAVEAFAPVLEILDRGP